VAQLRAWAAFTQQTAAKRARHEQHTMWPAAATHKGCACSRQPMHGRQRLCARGPTCSRAPRWLSGPRA
jgi:hypothetical protein